MKGYKVFNGDWTCRGFQYEVGKAYEMEEEPGCCKVGFHFCEKLSDCFSYYDFDSNNKVAEIVALGDINTDDDGKSCTNKIEILKELTWHEVLEKCNTGKGNTGYSNSGNYNSGHRNSGNRNSGDRNSGHRNSGNSNSGNSNSGDYNSGDYNSGDWNSGNWNSGDWNLGHRNSGDWNKTNASSGCFNTIELKIHLFNKPSNITIKEWHNMKARCILDEMPTERLDWIFPEYMTDVEKREYPEYQATGGILKLKNADNRQEWWDNLCESDKNEVLNIPNFDAGIFEEITGIKVD